MFTSMEKKFKILKIHGMQKNITGFEKQFIEFQKSSRISKKFMGVGKSLSIFKKKIANLKKEKKRDREKRKEKRTNERKKKKGKTCNKSHLVRW